MAATLEDNMDSVPTNKEDDPEPQLVRFFFMYGERHTHQSLQSATFYWLIISWKLLLAKDYYIFEWLGSENNSDNKRR